MHVNKTALMFMDTSPRGRASRGKYLVPSVKTHDLCGGLGWGAAMRHNPANKLQECALSCVRTRLAADGEHRAHARSRSTAETKSQ